MGISNLSHEELFAKLNELDNKNMNTHVYVPEEGNDFEDWVNENVLPSEFSKKSVLGVDIYQYSQYEPRKQTMIPFLFKLIYDEVSKNCITKSGFLFQKYKGIEDFRTAFLNTGDGGFQILDTPMHAVAFAINFQMLIRYYNSYRFYPSLRKMIGPINVRYSVTLDSIFQYEGNYYGPSIISNARVISKDSLNRFLIDENTYDWFMQTIMGVENLQFISNRDISSLPQFGDYDPEYRSEHEMIFPEERDFSYQKITSSDIQKIGVIRAKNSSISIYNLHLQFLGDLSGKELDDKPIAISIGNLNIGGID